MNLQKPMIAKHNSASRRGTLFFWSIFFLILLIACGSPPPALPGSSDAPSNSGDSPGQSAIPGKEEFGMTREELFTAIENVEAEISQCMSAAGFEYIAADYNTVRRGMTADKSLPGMG